MISKLFTKISKSHLLHKLTQTIRSFTFQNKQFHYFCHQYNTTYLNERAVEVPIVWSEVQRYPSEQVLEIGNVLSHYFPIHHRVIDKYEVAPGVINQDIVSFHTKKRFTLIVSISTLEHVGWDEPKRNKKKILRAMQQVKNLLAPNGVAIITLPLGYNTYLDSYVKTNTMKFAENFFLQRVSSFNAWHEVGKDILDKKPQYNYPYQNANVIVIGTYKT